ncbi:hypothetical protein D3C86_566830 [compost metagenome]
MPSCLSEPKPYCPTVNATAPSTPSGASRMIRPMILNMTWEVASIRRTTGLPRSPSCDSAQPNSTANSSTCSTSPVANGLTTVLGISFIRNSTVPPLVSLSALDT